MTFFDFISMFGGLALFLHSPAAARRQQTFGQLIRPPPPFFTAAPAAPSLFRFSSIPSQTPPTLRRRPVTLSMSAFPPLTRGADF